MIAPGVFDGSAWRARAWGHELMTSLCFRSLKVTASHLTQILKSQCQKRSTTVSKETYYSVKRDLGCAFDASSQSQGPSVFTR